MKNITLRCLLTVIILFCLRFVYIHVVEVPFFEHVFISTSIGFITSQVIVEVLINKKSHLSRTNYLLICFEK